MSDLKDKMNDTRCLRRACDISQSCNSFPKRLDIFREESICVLERHVSIGILGTNKLVNLIFVQLIDTTKFLERKISYSLIIRNR